MNSSISPTLDYLEAGTAAEPDRVVYNYFAYPGSLCLLPSGKLLAVFTAKKMQGPDESVGIYSEDDGKSWSPPQTLFGGPVLSPTTTDLDESYGDPNIVIVDEKRVVILCVSLLYAKGALDLRRTRFWRRISEDGGETFGPVEELPRHKNYYVGTVHRGLHLQNDTLLMGYSWDMPAETETPAVGEGGMGFVSGALISKDKGLSWQPGEDIRLNTEKASEHFVEAPTGIAEPSIVELPDGTLFLLGRTATTRLWQTFSHDGGQSWDVPTPSPLESHNCPAALLRLQNGNILVVYNNDPLHRANLSVSLSTDGCRSWSEPKVFAPFGHINIEEASYPASCELPDGTILVVFGQIDRSTPGSIFSIRYIRFNPESITSP